MNLCGQTVTISFYLGYGCPDNGCTLTDHSLVMSGEGIFDWRAAEKSEINPYICVSKCQRGFKWFARVGKCLMVVEEYDSDRTEYLRVHDICSNVNRSS